jgi:hypothetical protein
VVDERCALGAIRLELMPGTGVTVRAS